MKLKAVCARISKSLFWGERRTEQLKHIFQEVALLLILSISILVISFQPFSAAESSTRLYIDPPQVQKTYLDYGEVFNINVTVENITDLFSFDLKITWSNTLITFSSCYYNETLNAIWGSGKWLVQWQQQQPGLYRFAVKSTEGSFDTPSNQTLFTLEFRVEGPFYYTLEGFINVNPSSKLLDSNNKIISHTTEHGIYTIIGKTPTPTLRMSPSSVTNHKYCENFTITINLTDAINVEDFEFEIHYNSTLLGYVDVAWNVWQTGTMTVNEVNGNITAYTSGSPITGNQTLITIEFHAAYYHIWKDCPSWTNDLTGLIYIQWANLSYPDAPDLRYEKDVMYEIGVDPVKFTYVFSPIQGDVDNNGDVGIFDLRTVVYYYDIEQGDPDWPEASKYDLNCDDIIDLYDLVIISTNFGYEYDG